MTYNAQTGATFERNPDWWGGKTPLDGMEFIFFDATGPMVTAYQGDQVDAIVQFDVLSGASLFDDPNFAIIATEAALHRQIWMRTDKGQFTDKRVRQALAYTFDRPALIRSCSRARRRSATTMSSGRATRTSTRPSRSGPRTSRRPSSSCPTPARRT